MSECAICQSEIKDKVNMSCGSQHAFCFECVLKNIEVTGELRTCPLCNGGDKFIILDINHQHQNTDNYYSIYLFVKSLPVIKKNLKDKSQNTCIVPEKILQFYINNKTQLEFVHTLNKDYELDEIIKYIKWDSMSNIDMADMADIVMGLAGDYIFGSGGNSGGNGRGNVIYTTHYQ
jgi:hypothetical protein